MNNHIRPTESVDCPEDEDPVLQSIENDYQHAMKPIQRRMAAQSRSLKRYALGSSETWMFDTGKGRKEHSRRSMVSLIRFSPEQPKDLELHLIDRRSVQAWPGAALMLRIWEEIIGG